MFAYNRILRSSNSKTGKVIKITEYETFANQSGAFTFS